MKLLNSRWLYQHPRSTNFSSIRLWKESFVSTRPHYNQPDAISGKFRYLSCIIALVSRSICSKIYHAEHSPDNQRIIEGLISLFTRHPLSVDCPGSNHLGSNLTTEIVEAVLKGIGSWKVAYNFFTWASRQPGYHHNCYTYNVLASILSHARQNATLKLLALDIVNAKCSMSAGALGFFIRCLGSAGLVEEANMVFDRMWTMRLCVPNNYSYSCLLEAISKSNLVDLAEARLNEMQCLGWEPDKYTLTPLLQVYCNAGMFEKALNVFNHIYERGWVDAHILSILALSFTKWGEVDKAFELINRMEDFNVTLNERTFLILIHAFVSVSRLDKAVGLLEKMRKLGYLADIAVYDVLIRGLCKNEEVEKALYLYSEMINSGISADARILANLIQYVDEDQMLQLLEGSREILDNGSMILLYNSVVSGLVKNDFVDKAYYLVRVTMGDKLNCVRPNADSFKIVIDGLCKNGRLDEALVLLRDMNLVTCERDLLLYNNLVSALSRLDRGEECLDLLKEMKRYGLKPTHFTFNCIYDCFCRRQDTIAALNLVNEMRISGHEPWIKHTTTLIKLLSMHGRAIEACKFLASMVEEGFLPHIISYSAALVGLFKINEVDCALELFRDICSRGYRPDVVAYNILLNGLCNAERMPETQDFLQEMLDCGLVPSVVTYNSLINGWCKHNQIDQAMACFSKMSERCREPNVVTYTTLIDGLCNAGRDDDAVNLWNEMERKGCSPNRIAFMALISGLCKNGRPDVALVYLDEMDRRKLSADIFVYIALLSAFLFQRKPLLAFDVLKDMVEKKKLPDTVDKHHSLLKDAIFELFKNPSTKSDIEILLRSGSIPTISLMDVMDETGRNCTG